MTFLNSATASKILPTGLDNGHNILPLQLKVLVAIDNALKK